MVENTWEDIILLQGELNSKVDLVKILMINFTRFSFQNIGSFFILLFIYLLT